MAWQPTHSRRSSDIGVRRTKTCLKSDPHPARPASRAPLPGYSTPSPPFCDKRDVRRSFAAFCHPEVRRGVRHEYRLCPDFSADLEVTGSAGAFLRPPQKVASPWPR
jgi:hypothetical protein